MTKPLGNARHEKFAQELAKGSTADAAYVAAGYKPHASNPARLSGNERVRARVAALKERAAEKAAITVSSITERLLKIAEKGEASNEAPMLSVARASLMDAAKLNGLVIDIKDLRSTDGSMTPREPTYRLVKSDDGKTA